MFVVIIIVGILSGPGPGGLFSAPIERTAEVGDVTAIIVSPAQ